MSSACSNSKADSLVFLQLSEKQKLLKMEKTLRKEVVGQDEAVSAVANAIRLNRSGLSNADRPIASFLFCGPSGTGKTQLAKSLAKFLFDSPDAMLRIDASEYSEKHTVAKLLGAPAGYVGYNEGEKLRSIRFGVARADNSLPQVDS